MFFEMRSCSGFYKKKNIVEIHKTIRIIQYGFEPNPLNFCSSEIETTKNKKRHENEMDNFIVLFPITIVWAMLWATCDMHYDYMSFSNHISLSLSLSLSNPSLLSKGTF